MTTLTVSLTDCTREHRKRTRVCRTDDPEIAIDRAMRAWYGSRARWWPDHELPGYGQVVKPLDGNPGAYTCLTPRCRLEVLTDTPRGQLAVPVVRGDM